MCGFLVSNCKKINSDTFGNALSLLRHRGPDASNYVHEKSWHIGHARLKILDLDNRSNQPFYSEDGKYVIVYNGEIYNFKELAVKHGIECRTSGDTEVLLGLYQLLGSNMLNELNGMFAFAIINLESDEVFVARDRLGIKPLYIRHMDGDLTVCSEVRPILDIHGSHKYDEYGIRQYAKMRAFFNGRTLYKGIEMMQAGCYYQGGSLKRYWKLPNEHKKEPEDDELKELVEDAVKRRCISDVAVGSYLSGGLDSTIVAGLSGKPHTWTIGFDGYNEFEWARIAAKRFDSYHHEVKMDRGDFLGVARAMILERLEPLSVPNEVLLKCMTEKVKKHNTVVLSGEGADELFFGYDRIFRWANNAKVWDFEEFSSMYSYGKHDDLEIVEEVLDPFVSEGGSCLDIVARFFQVAHLHGLLRRVDNSTMRCSVEARVPFVDHLLVERMAGVPFGFRMQNNIVKAPLKRVFSDLVPHEIIYRKKIGFPVPLEEILQGIPSPEDGPSKTSLDQWLHFNLETLIGCRISLEDLGVYNQ